MRQHYNRACHELMGALADHETGDHHDALVKLRRAQNAVDLAMGVVSAALDAQDTRDRERRVREQRRMTPPEDRHG